MSSVSPLKQYEPSSATAPADHAYHVIRTGTKDLGRQDFSGITVHTKIVHIDGAPSWQALRAIVKFGPNVEVVELPGSTIGQLSPSRKQFLTDHGIEFREGLYREDLSGKNSGPKSERYRKMQGILASLEGQPLKDFEELLRRKCEVALVTARYLCRNGEEFLPLYAVANLFGRDYDACRASIQVNAMLHYLDPTFKVSKASRTAARGVKLMLRYARSKDAKARQKRLEKQRVQRAAKRFGFESLPPKMPLKFARTFIQVHAARLDGRFQKLTAYQAKVLDLRYDAENLKFRIFSEIHQELGYRATVQSISETEKIALEKLGIL